MLKDDKLKFISIFSFLFVLFIFSPVITYASADEGDTEAEFLVDEEIGNVDLASQSDYGVDEKAKREPATAERTVTEELPQIEAPPTADELIEDFEGELPPEFDP